MGIKTLLFLSLFCASTAQSQVTGISGTSLTVSTSATTFTDAWGVFVGTYDPNETSPHNNCNFAIDDIIAAANGTVGTNGLFHGCHPKRAVGDSIVTVNFKYSTDATTGGLFPRAYIVRKNTTGGSTSNHIIETNTTTPVLTGEGDTTVSFTWRTLCTKVGGTFKELAQRCSTNARVEISFGVGSSESSISNSGSVIFNMYRPHENRGSIAPGDCTTSPPSLPVGEPNNYGFCDVALFPGDKGGFLVNIADGLTSNVNRFISLAVGTIDSTADSDLTSGEIEPKVTGVRLYTGLTFAQAFPDAPEATTNFFDLLLEISPSQTDATFTERFFGGKLPNGIQQFVRVATIDSSGTIAQLFEGGASGFCPTTNCPYQFTPSKVAGLIEKNECFITTATYGSDQTHQVDLFRDFRRKFLFTNKIGHKIINLYNTYGPIGAHWIRSNPNSQKYARAALYPFYTFAYISVHYGMFASSSLLLLIAAALFSLIRSYKRKDN